jgi:hypothetical protein
MGFGEIYGPNKEKNTKYTDYQYVILSEYCVNFRFSVPKTMLNSMPVFRSKYWVCSSNRFSRL